MTYHSDIFITEIYIMLLKNKAIPNPICRSTIICWGLPLYKISLFFKSFQFSIKWR